MNAVQEPDTFVSWRCPVFWLCQTVHLWNYRISFVRTWYSGNHTKSCHV